MAEELMDIIKGIGQVMAQTYDGALDSEGKPIKSGLKREEKIDFRKERRLLDGFKARMCSHTDNDESFPCVIISYHSELKLEAAHSKKLEGDTEEHIAEAVKYLKREFKKVTGKELNLRKYGEMRLNTEQTSRIRTFVTAQCHYRITEVSFPKSEQKEDTKRSAALEKWLQLGGLKK